MKKIIFLPLIFALLIFSSCEQDDSLTPTPVLVSGSFVRLDISSKLLNFDDSAVLFGGRLTAPGGNVSKYNLYVRRTDADTGTSFGDFILLTTVTSFPTDLIISQDDIATKLGMDVSDFKVNDEFRFYGEAFNANGVRSDYSNLSTTIRSNLAYYKQAFRFRTELKAASFFTPLELSVYDNYTVQ